MNSSNGKMSIACYPALENPCGQSRLHVAAMIGNIEKVQELIEDGGDIDILDNQMRTPLHYATTYNKTTNIANLLILCGADVNRKDFMNRRPLHFAISKISKGQMLRLLMNKGAYVNVRDELGNTPLTNAIILDCIDSVETLISYGADINERSVFNLLLRLDWNNRSLNSLLYYWIKLKAADMYYFSDYDTFFTYHYDLNKYQQFYQECLSEIEKLKSTLIDERKSFYSFLRSHPSCLRNYTKNEKLKSLIGSLTMGKQFPKYSYLILAKYREAVARNLLLEPAREAWYVLTGIQLPDSIYEIFAYLSSGDLISLMDAADITGRMVV